MSGEGWGRAIRVGCKNEGSFGDNEGEVSIAQRIEMSVSGYCKIEQKVLKNFQSYNGVRALRFYVAVLLTIVFFCSGSVAQPMPGPYSPDPAMNAAALRASNSSWSSAIGTGFSMLTHPFRYTASAVGAWTGYGGDYAAATDGAASEKFQARLDATQMSVSEMRYLAIADALGAVESAAIALDGKDMQGQSYGTGSRCLNGGLVLLNFVDVVAGTHGAGKAGVGIVKSGTGQSVRRVAGGGMASLESVIAAPTSASTGLWLGINQSSRATSRGPFGVNWFRTSRVKKIMGRTEASRKSLQAVEDGRVNLTLARYDPGDVHLYGKAYRTIDGFDTPEAFVYLRNVQRAEALGGVKMTGYERVAGTATHEVMHCLGIGGSKKAELRVRLAELEMYGATIDRDLIRKTLKEFKDQQGYRHLPWRKNVSNLYLKLSY